MQLDVLTDGGRVLIERAFLQGLPATDALTHLAIGTGVVVDGGGLMAPERTASALQNEIGRALWLERSYVVADSAGAVVVGGAAYTKVTDPQPIMYFRFRFLEDEAQGDWSEIGLYGGGVTFIQRGALLLDAGLPSGDERANFQVILGGAYTGPDNQQISVTVTTGGTSGVAEIAWASTGSEPGASGVPVTADVPVPIGGTGLTLTFDFGDDDLLTAGDSWEIRATRSPDSANFASGGVYDPVGNEAGQVASAGVLVRLVHIDPPEMKGAVTLDVRFIARVLNL